MSKVDIIGKWDLNNNSWYDPYTEEERGKSLSLVSLKNVITGESYNYEYFIFCPGIRLENVSKDSKIVSDKAGNIDKAIKYIEQHAITVIDGTITTNKHELLEILKEVE